VVTRHRHINTTSITSIAKTLIKQAKMEDFAWFLEDPDHAAAVQDFDFI
jgi:hypothetical protein